MITINYVSLFLLLLVVTITNHLFHNMLVKPSVNDKTGNTMVLYLITIIVILIVTLELISI